MVIWQCCNGCDRKILPALGMPMLVYMLLNMVIWQCCNGCDRRILPALGVPMLVYMLLGMVIWQCCNGYDPRILPVHGTRSRAVIMLLRTEEVIWLSGSMPKECNCCHCHHSFQCCWCTAVPSSSHRVILCAKWVHCWRCMSMHELYCTVHNLMVIFPQQCVVFVYVYGCVFSLSPARWWVLVQCTETCWCMLLGAWGSAISYIIHNPTPGYLDTCWVFSVIHLYIWCVCQQSQQKNCVKTNNCCWKTQILEYCVRSKAKQIKRWNCKKSFTTLIVNRSIAAQVWLVGSDLWQHRADASDLSRGK